MTTVDPFIIPVPRKIAQDPELAPFFNYLIRFCHDLWLRTGGANDNIDDLEGINTFETSAVLSRLSGLNKKINELEDLVLLSGNNSLLLDLENKVKAIEYLLAENAALSARIAKLTQDIEEIEVLAYVN